MSARVKIELISFSRIKDGACEQWQHILVTRSGFGIDFSRYAAALSSGRERECREREKEKIEYVSPPL